MIDHVQEKQELLKRAAKGGSLSNEKAFRDSIEAFQNGFREQKDMVVDISSSADKLFELDMANVQELQTNSKDPEIRRLAGAMVRSFEYLQRTK